MEGKARTGQEARKGGSDADMKTLVVNGFEQRPKAQRGMRKKNHQGKGALRRILKLCSGKDGGLRAIQKSQTKNHVRTESTGSRTRLQEEAVDAAH